MKRKIILSFGICLFLCACQNLNANKAADVAQYSLAVNAGNNMERTKYVPIPMPGQLMSTRQGKTSQRLVGEAAIEEANKKAMKQPNSGEYINSIMTFNYMSGALYQVYCAPLNVTDVQFQNNEHVVAVGAGDTARWQVSKTYSGAGATRQEHLLIKPIEADITNSLVVTTDLRTYHLMLHSTNKTYMASVTWRYPDGDGNIIASIGEHDSAADIANNVDVNNMRFDYQVKLLKGPVPDWYPRMVFNDGSKTYIKFSNQAQESPTLFVGTNAQNNQIINYRVKGNYYVVDNVIRYAQLRGGLDNKTVVQISTKKY